MRSALILMLTLMFASCGLPNDKALGELDSDEKDTLCDSVEAESATCSFDGVEVDLERSKATCLSTLDNIKSGCSFTVGEYEDCITQPICEALEDPACELPSDCL